jgi:hypothetical protein
VRECAGSKKPSRRPTVDVAILAIGAGLTDCEST